jgi:sterol desaturase/sphingolipid hydroxylase (fatty acid hydroxylase superfamily)
LPGWIVTGAVVTLIGGTFAQYFHGSLHREQNPWFVTTMRRIGILMTPAAHEKHHATLQRDFSTNCGWSNPLLNRVFNALRRRGRLPDHGLEPTS